MSEEQPYYDARSGRSQGVGQHVKSKATWLRLVFMILFALIFSVVRIVTGVVVLVQFLQVLFTGQTNRKLLDFGHSLAAYSYEVTAYLTYNTEVRPFPFEAPWPPPAPPVSHPPAAAPSPPPAQPASSHPASPPSAPSSFADTSPATESSATPSPPSTESSDASSSSTSATTPPSSPGSSSSGDPPL